MPPIGQLLRGLAFSNLFVVLGAGNFPTLKAAKDAGAATVNYGVFMNTVINFLIVALVMFMLVRVTNRLKREQPAPAAVLSSKDCPFCDRRSDQSDPVPALHERLRRASGGLMEFTASQQ